MRPRRAVPFAFRCAALCAGLAALVAPLARASGGTGVPAEVSAELIESLRAARDRAAPVAELTRRIGESAAPGLPLLISILGAERVPAPADDDEAQVQQLSVVQREMILGALEQAGRAEVLAPALELVAAAPAEEADRVAVQVLGAVGSAQDLGTLLGRALGPDAPADAELGEPLRARFEESVTRLLRREPGAYAQLLRVAPSARPELLPALLFAVGAARDPLGLAFVQQVLERDPGLARTAISQVRLMGPSLSVQRNEELMDRVRPYLRPTEKETCQAAALALAELGDEESVPALLQLLESDTAGIRDDALWALRRVTGMSFPADARIWGEWYDAELEWLDADAPALIQQLTASDPAKVAEAVKHLTRHRLHRHALARLVAEELPRASADLRVLMCRTLGRLESYHAVPELLDAAEDRNAKVSAAAWEALQEVTKRDLERDPEVWRAALFAEE